MIKISLNIALNNLWYNQITQIMKELKLSKTFIALRHPNFRLWFIGQVISLIGTWMQATAQGYLVYELTNSSAYLGAVAFANGLPTLFFSTFGGLIADRISKRKMIIITQSSMMVLAFILAILSFTGWVQAWHIIILAFLLGIANAFDAPARQAFIVEMVSREDLANAIALNSTIFNLGTLVGPSAAGLIYAWLGPSWCFTINGISFIGVIGALLLMKLQSEPVVSVSRSALKNLKEGFQFVLKEPRIRLILVYVGLVSIFGFSLLTLVPAWAVKILGGDVRTNGWLLSARGAGSLVGALMVAYVGSKATRHRIWQFGWYLMPVALVGFGLLRWVPGSLLVLAVMGWGLMTVLNISNALIQSYVPDHLRGRVMSVYVLVFMGTSPIGSLLAGSVAAKFGEPSMVFLSAGVMTLAALGTLFFRKTIKTF